MNKLVKTVILPVKLETELSPEWKSNSQACKIRCSKEIKRNLMVLNNYERTSLVQEEGSL